MVMQINNKCNEPVKQNTKTKIIVKTFMSI